MIFNPNLYSENEMEHAGIRNHLYIFIDESGTSGNEDILYMTLVATEDPDSIRKSISSLIENIKLDPILSNNIRDVREKGITHFHYTSDHQEIRTEFIKLMNGLNFDAYVCFARKSEIASSFNKNELLIKLFSTLLYPRIQEKHYTEIFVVYESFDEGSAQVESSFQLATENLSRKILVEFCKLVKKVEVSFDNKSELCLGISDYLCGIVSRYIMTVVKGNNIEDSLEEREYNRVSKKIRLIHDLTRKKFYSRHNPLDIESLKN